MEAKSLFFFLVQGACQVAGHGVDIASVIPESDAMRRPGYTISKYGTGMAVLRASLVLPTLWFGDPLYVWRQGSQGG